MQLQCSHKPCSSQRLGCLPVFLQAIGCACRTLRGPCRIQSKFGVPGKQATQYLGPDLSSFTPDPQSDSTVFPLSLRPLALPVKFQLPTHAASAQ